MVALFGVYCIVVVDVKTAMTSASTPATAMLMVVVVVMLVASMMATVRGHVVSEDIASFRQPRPPIL